MRNLMGMVLVVVCLASPVSAGEAGPTVKISGNLAFSPMNDVLPLGQYDYSRADRSSSVNLNGSGATGAGFSVEWSPSEAGGLWLEAGIQKPHKTSVRIDTTYRKSSALPELQNNNHSISMTDYMVGIKGNGTAKSRYFSILIGAGIHHRQLMDSYEVSNYINYGGGQFAVGSSSGRTRANQTRVYASLDLELYPAGKDRHVGLALSGKALSNGDREQWFTTDTLLDKGVIIGIQPGWYDVTARLLVQF